MEIAMIQTLMVGIWAAHIEVLLMALIGTRGLVTTIRFVEL